jgi:3-oxoacyl-[acyl-carrier protein] reductase
MEARGGGAILVGTSSTVKEPVPHLALSNVLRAGVTALAKTLSVELAPLKIRVNTLLPGRIATDRLRSLDEIGAKREGISVDEQARRAQATVPLGRYGDPAEFGRVGAFLLSDAASYITGTSVQVDGGLIKGLL